MKDLLLKWLGLPLPINEYKLVKCQKNLGNNGYVCSGPNEGGYNNLILYQPKLNYLNNIFNFNQDFVIIDIAKSGFTQEHIFQEIIDRDTIVHIGKTMLIFPNQHIIFHGDDFLFADGIGTEYEIAGVSIDPNIIIKH